MGENISFGGESPESSFPQVQQPESLKDLVETKVENLKQEEVLAGEKTEEKSDNVTEEREESYAPNSKMERSNISPEDQSEIDQLRESLGQKKEEEQVGRVEQIEKLTPEQVEEILSKILPESLVEQINSLNNELKQEMVEAFSLFFEVQALQNKELMQLLIAGNKEEIQEMAEKEGKEGSLDKILRFLTAFFKLVLGKGRETEAENSEN
ncbi:MAG: hypothetical protein UT18_C0011G0007 [candidate division CPR2 bacterium GW2011_GWC2_39_10]|uniref:Uncharacterized protein n=1 Tax=candidate division CPR2 bacterium GW2011_GWC2_39_10 TaxID=1618345 RepID=A0A0G0PY04_UNCC2|nr:MAG: hypothetical protein UT18_C0011G0007 [candidate division CPR2 bacterium GW2011_GWC2_39_10]